MVEKAIYLNEVLRIGVEQYEFSGQIKYSTKTMKKKKQFQVGNVAHHKVRNFKGRGMRVAQ